MQNIYSLKFLRIPTQFNSFTSHDLSFYRQHDICISLYGHYYLQEEVMRLAQPHVDLKCCLIFEYQDDQF